MNAVVILLEKKQRRLSAHRSLPFEEQSESNYRTIKFLESELSAFVGLVATLEKLRNTYLEFTGSVADQLIRLTVQRDYYPKELMDLMAAGGVYLS
ncbi:hypothetical protein [Runella sp.]|uniref:hypothetical protein n=1 Tax=Runella sp. TaxID=1960881 RepID=UPI003D132720